MISPALLRDEPELVKQNLARRGCDLDSERFAALDKQLREARMQEEQLRQERNAASDAIGKLFKEGKREEAEKQKAAAAALGDKISAAHAEVEQAQQAFNDFMLVLPNLLHDEVPAGTSADDNRLIREVGTPPQFDFELRDHVALGELHGMLDFATAAQMAQARFAVMRGAGARLHRALAQFMLDMHVREHGYQETWVPYLVNTAALTNTGQLPKFGTDDEFFSMRKDDLHLIPTSEVSLANLAADRVFTAKELPLRVASHSPCFRREAGSYGQDTRGMLRQHQFDKVELVQVVAPDKSEEAHQELLGHAEAVMQKLELPYRVVELCAGDTGAAANRTFDIEVWLPGQQCYREISSVSNDTDYQARRMRARCKGADGNTLVHILNGSGVAVGRAWIAVLENGQQADGSIDLPKALQPYFDDRAAIPAP